MSGWLGGKGVRLSCQVIPKTIIKMVQTASLFGTHALGRSLTVQPDCLKGQVVCGTVYGDMHLKDLMGSIARVGYCNPVPDFYLVLHGFRCTKSTIMD